MVLSIKLVTNMNGLLLFLLADFVVNVVNIEKWCLAISATIWGLGPEGASARLLS